MTANEILKHTDHRPFPLPRMPWGMMQEWHDLLFAHWSVPPSELKSLLPDSLELDLYNGSAWVGVTPFEVRNLQLRYMPPLPWARRFYEVNVRTYVRYRNKPGVYFFSLDASSVAAVLGARMGACLPYYRAQIDVALHENNYTYRSRRTGTDHAELDLRYAPEAGVFDAAPGSLEAFLTERYCLFTRPAKRTYEIDIHHCKWPLRPAQADIRVNTLPASAGITSHSAAQPMLHFAKYLKVLIWFPRHAKPLT